jgi:ATP-binding cassette subfamily G (WHITE) protein 2 (SNQ2)
VHSRYEPANRQTTADFLVAVTDPNGRIPRAGISNQPRSSAEFAEYFLKSNIGAQNRQEVDSYMAQFVGKPALAEAYKESAHAEFEGANRMKRYFEQADIFSFGRIADSHHVAHTC